MYNRKAFQTQNPHLLLEFIETIGFGTLISTNNENIETSYLPFVLDRDRRKLVAHMARANPHWKMLEKQKVLVSFKGPDRYISPSIYAQPLNVPTWNYAVLEVRGRADVYDDAHHVESILKNSVTHFESRNGSSWKYELPKNFTESLINAVVGIEIDLEVIEGKFKLSQNRELQDFVAVEAFLEQSKRDNDREMLNWMRKTAQPHPTSKS